VSAALALMLRALLRARNKHVSCMSWRDGGIWTLLRMTCSRNLETGSHSDNPVDSEHIGGEDR